MPVTRLNRALILAAGLAGCGTETETVDPAAVPACEALVRAECENAARCLLVDSVETCLTEDLPECAAAVEIGESYPSCMDALDSSQCVEPLDLDAVCLDALYVDELAPRNDEADEHCTAFLDAFCDDEIACGAYVSSERELCVEDNRDACFGDMSELGACVAALAEPECLSLEDFEALCN